MTIVSPASALPKAPLLSILIPSYNRGARVKALVSFLLPLVASYQGMIEIVVSNNKSTDNTSTLLADITDPHFRLVNRDIHLPTAEENMFESVELCNGEFIWFHGDDDIPYLSTIRHGMTLLSDGSHDALAFRSRFIDHESSFSGGWFFRMNADVMQVDFTAGACAIGLTSSFAGITNTILRRSTLVSVDWREILATAPIYSHVAWWLIAFKGKKITFVNRPLVSYRVDDPVKIGEHFKRLAKRTNVPDFHFWTVGLARLFNYLEAENAITPENISRIVEVRRDGTQFRLLDNMVEMMQMQALLSAEHRESRNHLNSDDFEKLKNWVLHIDLSYFECLIAIENTFALRKSDPSQTKVSRQRAIEEVRTDFRRIMDRKSSAASAMPDFVGFYQGYATYSHLTGFVGFDGGSVEEHLHWLRAVDVVNDRDGIVYDVHLTDLQKRIDNIRVRQREMASTMAERAELNRIAEAIRNLNRVADAIYTNANAVFEAGRFPHVSLARSVVWRILRLRKYLRRTSFKGEKTIER